MSETQHRTVHWVGTGYVVVILYGILLCLVLWTVRASFSARYQRVKLDGDRHVTCVVAGAGIDCDWEHADR